MFILAAQRDEDPSGSFSKYREYVKDNELGFPKEAYALATSDWYFDFRRHECPHDAWLEWVRIEESLAGERKEVRTVAMTIKLLGAYHDGTIEIRYPRVFEYRLNTVSLSLESGHRDWRYDEFRVNEEGRLVHEIEWGGYRDTGSWLIVASDIEFRWRPTK